MTDTAFLLVWKALAFERIARLADTRKAFSTEDVWEILDALPKPSDPRALGPILRQAQDAKVIVKSDFTTPSRRRDCHARPVAVWLSGPLAGSDRDAAEYVLSRKGAVAAPVQDGFTFAKPVEVQ